MLETVANYSQKIEHYSSKLSKFVKDKQNELLVKNSDLARCLKILDDATSERTLLEENLHKHYLKDQEMKRNINQIKLAIINLYDRVYQTYSIKKPSYKYHKPNNSSTNNNSSNNDNSNKNGKNSDKNKPKTSNSYSSNNSSNENKENQSGNHANNNNTSSDDDQQYAILLHDVSQRIVDLIDIVQTYQNGSHFSGPTQ